MVLFIINCELTACRIFFDTHILASRTATRFSVSNSSICLVSVCSLCSKVYTPISSSLMCGSPNLTSKVLPSLMAAFPCRHSSCTTTYSCIKSSWPHSDANSLSSRSRLWITEASSFLPMSCSKAHNLSLNMHESFHAKSTNEWWWWWLYFLF